MNEPANVLVIVNHVAARVRRAWPGIRDALVREEVRFDVHETRHAGDARERTRDALHAGVVRTIAVVGGDGTLSEAASGFFERDEPTGDSASPPPRNINPAAALAVLPAGTGDDFARGLTNGRRAPLAEWIARLATHCRASSDDHAARGSVGTDLADTTTTRLVDVIDASASVSVSVGSGDDEGGARRFICLNAATLGIGAEVAARVASQGSLTQRLSGEARFALAALGALAAWRNRLVRIQLDGGEWRELKTNLLAISNGAYSGGGMNLAPGTTIDDGLLDVVTVSDLSRLVIVRELARIHRGGHLANPRVRVVRAATVRVETIDTSDALGIEADGDARGHTPAEFRIVPAALRVVW